MSAMRGTFHRLLATRSLCSDVHFGICRLPAPDPSYYTPAKKLPTSSCRVQMMPHDAPAPKMRKAIYEAEGDMEPFERYTVGGCYPARIGELLCSSRYCIVHKLGYGASSTTWLARDEYLAKYVAIKICRADMPPAENNILETLRDVSECDRKAEVGSATIRKFLNEFEIQGPTIQGTKRLHRCLVMTPARISIAVAREASNIRLFELSVARAIAAQLVHAVAFLHSQGVVHADLHEGNFLLCLPNSIDELAPDQLYEQYGKPRFTKITRLDKRPLDPWVPTHGVLPIWFGGASDALSIKDAKFILSDFGESFHPAIEKRLVLYIPLPLRPPEILLHLNPQVSFSTEIWSLACGIFAIMGQQPLFESWFPIEDEVIAEQLDCLGDLPEEWREKWANREQFFDDQLHWIDGSPCHSLEDRFEDSIQASRNKFGMAQMCDEEKRVLLILLRSMLSFGPHERPSIHEVMESAWMRDWASPAFAAAQNTKLS